MGMKEVVEHIMDAFNYNRSTVWMKFLVKELLERIDNTPVRYSKDGRERVNRSEDGDVIYGFLVLCYGEYGTSPRSGWIMTNYINELKNALNDYYNFLTITEIMN